MRRRESRFSLRVVRRFPRRGSSSLAGPRPSARAFAPRSHRDPGGGGPRHGPVTHRVAEVDGRAIGAGWNSPRSASPSRRGSPLPDERWRRRSPPHVPAGRPAVLPRAVEARSPPRTVEVEPEEERVTLPAPQPFPPDPVPRPDPPLPLPEPSPVPEPQPEPEPEPEELAAEAALRAELEETRRTLDRARAETEAFVRSRTEELTAKEQGIAGREAAIASKEEVVEARAHAAAERLAGLEKDTARREGLRFLTTGPGGSVGPAHVIATAFPDMASLGAADAKALAQCKGVTAALAPAIRLELPPRQAEQEQRP